MVKYHIGDTVKWTSQAGGFSKTKKGHIAAVVPPGKTGKEMVTGNVPDGRYNLGPIDACGAPRDHVSYLVVVNDSKTGRGKDKIYWPFVSRLRKED